MCHQPNGQGAPPAFPPLAGSDWLLADRARAIKVLCEGLDGPITVNGRRYNNAMPAQVLDDAQVAEVMTYITNTWGNQAAAFTPDEVAAVRTTTRFKTFADLQKAAAYSPLPKPPAGWSLREVAQTPVFATRLAGGAGGAVYVLGERGTIHRLENDVLAPWVNPGDYADLTRGALSALGLTLGPDQRLWLVTNQKTTDREPHDLNEVTLWRSGPLATGEDAALNPPKFTRWFHTTYPYGIGPFNHGVSHLAFGPDGRLYVASGSRTDSGEPGQNPRAFTGGETDITACLWRLDPKAENPAIEVIARGLRNPYGFAWDDHGRLFTMSNGPDADAPEEMDIIEGTGHHHGFPYQFSNWPLTPKPYPHTPDPPAGLDPARFVRPVLNVGPDAGGGAPGGLATFDPHSCPTGVVWCDDTFPDPMRRSFIVGRYGNLLATPVDVGFDLLSVRPEKRDNGTWIAHVTRLLAPLGRPVDVLHAGNGKLLILEYTRPTNFKDGTPWLPGRILELAPTTAAH